MHHVNNLFKSPNIYTCFAKYDSLQQQQIIVVNCAHIIRSTF